MDYAEKIQRCHEYVEALEEERRKIQVFQRELPLCLELVIQAIEACKRELSGATTTEFTHGQSECSEQTTSSDGTGTTRPMVLEEFIPIKRTNSSSHNENEHDDDDEEEEDEHHSHKGDESMNDKDEKKKSDWLRSVQLWNPSSPDPPVKEDLPRKAAVTEVKRNGGAFQPFHKEKCEKSNTAGKNNQSGNSVAKTQSSSVPASDTSSSDETKTREASKNNDINNNDGGCGGGGDNSKKEEKDGQSQRKQRRCWSPELHRRFLHSLQQLGGSHATPKQIRELMKVDGLTNDEVKSHLQKYRLHTRRPSPTMHNNNNAQAPQFVVVGGIWVPPPDYAVAAATTTSCETTTITGTNGIYAPVATLPVTTHLQKHTQFENVQSEGRSGNHSTEGGRRRGCGVRSNSPATSSSTHTTTNSPVF